jgi:toxin HigB-1
MEFGNRGTEDLYDGLDSERARKVLPRGLHGKLQSNLLLLAYAESLEYLRVPPSNHLEKLRGDIGPGNIPFASTIAIVFASDG